MNADSAARRPEATPEDASVSSDRSKIVSRDDIVYQRGRRDSSQRGSSRPRPHLRLDDPLKN